LQLESVRRQAGGLRYFKSDFLDALLAPAHASLLWRNKFWPASATAVCPDECSPQVGLRWVEAGGEGCAEEFWFQSQPMVWKPPIAFLRRDHSVNLPYFREVALEELCTRGETHGKKGALIGDRGWDGGIDSTTDSHSDVE